MPHLAGLAHLVRVVPTRHLDVAAVGPRRRLRQFRLFGKMPLADAAFVLAHELLHLALDTHERQGEANPHLVNVATITSSTTCSPRHGPRRAAEWAGAAGRPHESLESLVVDLSKHGKGGRVGCWDAGRAAPRRRPRPGKSPIREAWKTPALCRRKRRRRVAAGPARVNIPVRRSAYRRARGNPRTGHAAGAAAEVAPGIAGRRQALPRRPAAPRWTRRSGPDALTEPQRGERLMDALHTAYQPPWQLAPAVLAGRRRPGRPVLRERRGVGPSATTASCCAAGCARAGRCTSFSTRVARWPACCRRFWA